jgi:hypothetical protein
MKIVKKGTIPKKPTREDWVGMVEECLTCGTFFQIETVDDVEPMIGDDGWVMFTCPLCGEKKPCSPQRFYF